MKPRSVTISSAAKRDGRKHSLNLRPVLFVLRWKFQTLAQKFRWFVDGKTGAISGYFEQNAPRLAKGDRVKIETVDHRCQVQTALDQLLAPTELLFFIGASKSNVMHRAGGIHSELCVRSLNEIHL